MKKILSTILTVTALAGLVTMAKAEEKTITFFVSGSAVENGDGSLEKPFNTFEAAKNAIRDLKNNGEYPEGGVTVMVRGGDYYLSEAIKFTEEDSGRKGAPVTYCVYPGEHAKLIGGVEIKLGDCEVVTSDSVLSRLDENMAGKVYQINLKEKGIKDYGRLRVTGHAASFTDSYGLTDGDTKYGAISAPEIFYTCESGETVTMNLAQYPDSGQFMNVGKIVSAGDNMTQWYENEDPNKPMAPEPAVFAVDDDRIRRWGEAEDAWVFGYWQYDWSDQTMPVDKIDIEAKTIKPGIQSYYKITQGQRFYIYNLLEELNSPGEWFYDKKSGNLYLYPIDNNNESTMILGFSNENVIEIDGADFINIRDFEITGTRNNGVMVKGNNIKLSYLAINRVSSIGVLGIGSNITVEGCYIHTTGKRGIDVDGGSNVTLEPSNNLIFNNHIHNNGRLVTTYHGGIRVRGCGSIVKNNHLYDGTHLGIELFGNDHIIEYNEIHDYLKKSSDMGAIYMNAKYVERGNVMRYNHIYNCISDSGQVGGGETGGSWSLYGIYLDNFTSGVSVYGNVINDVQGDAVFVNGGRDNIVKNNIFANLSEGVKFYASAMNQSWGWYQNLMSGSNNRGLAIGENVYGVDTYKYMEEPYTKYPHLENILEDDFPKPKYNVIKENVAYNTTGIYFVDPMTEDGSGMKSDEMYELNEIDEGFLTERNVGFKNVGNKDFTLNDDSMVYEKYPEFEKIDDTKIGLITSQLKGILENDSVALAIGKPSSYVNWERKLIDENNIDVTPFIENNVTYVPVRFLSESLGASAEWENGKAYIELNGDAIVFTPGSTEVEYKGALIDIENPMIIRNDRIFVPLRAVSELYGKKVFWDDCGLVVVSGYDIESVMNQDRIYDLYNRM